MEIIDSKQLQVEVQAFSSVKLTSDLRGRDVVLELVNVTRGEDFRQQS